MFQISANMCKKITICFAATVLFFNSLSSQIVSYNFNVSPFLQASSVDGHLTAGNLSISSGSIATEVYTGTYFTDEPYIDGGTSWISSDSSTAKNFYFNVNAQSGYRFNITSISFDAYVIDNGPSATTIFVNNLPIGTYNLPSTALQNVSFSTSDFNRLTSCTIKIAGWLNNSRISTGTSYFRIDNVIVNGTVEVIPPNDANSSLTAGPLVEPLTISSLINAPDSIGVLDFIIRDSATTDAVVTLIDSLIVTPAAGNQFSDWSKILSSANLYSKVQQKSFQGTIQSNRIKFNTSGFTGIASGSADTLILFATLNKTLSNADNQHLGFELTASNLYCKSTGSSVSSGTVSNASNELKITIEVTQLNAGLFPSVIFVDSVYSITACAIDANGNTDVDWNGDVSLSALAEHAVLISDDNLNTVFTNGVAVWHHCRVNLTDTLQITIAAENIEEKQQQVIAAQPIFYEPFEQNNLNQWLHTSDWTIASSSPIEGNYSLKHNLTGIGGLSYISAHYADSAFNNGKTTWRLVLRNGNFDPTTSNRFWYCLMANDSNLASASNYGYVVGVNFTGDTDSLSLWRFDASGTKVLLLQSALDWNANTTAYIEVNRDVPGNWQLGYSVTNSFSNLNYTSKITDKTYTNLAYHGLVFQFSSTRAGLLWADSLTFFKINTPPVLIALTGLNDSTLIAGFSEPIDSLTAVQLANYQISSATDAGITMQSILFDRQNPAQIVMKVNRLKTATYTLTAHGIKDKSGLDMAAQQMDVEYFVSALPHDLVINEVMFDCSPVVGLPEYDYLELYNRASNQFLIGGWKLHIGDEIRTMPAARIQPGGYMIVTSSGALVALGSYGIAINGITTTTLTNSGKALSLYSPENVLIDSVFYKPEWISDENKSDGGWSLERIDPANFCGEGTNWTVSTDPAGGTPGSQNSAYRLNTDTQAPLLTAFHVLTSNTVSAEFSEEINPSTVTNTNNWIIQPAIPGNANVAVSSDKKTAILTLAQNIQPNIAYSLHWQNIEDLCGNTFQDTIVNFLNHPTEPNDLIINEIMADPTPVMGLPEFDYLELYNRSHYAVNLSGWTIKIGSTTKTFNDLTIQPQSFLIACPAGQDSLFSEFGQVDAILSSTSLVTTGKDIVLKDASGIRVDSVYYQPIWYGDDNKTDGGWSLERIDPDNFCGQSTNWKASVDSSGGTPGKVNSVYQANIDTISPFLVSWKFASRKSIEIAFSEEINPDSLIQLSNWIFEPVLTTNANILLGQDGKSVLLESENEFKTDSVYQLQWQGITDLCGNPMADTVLVLVYHQAQPYEVVINEIMADPTPVVGLPESDYIELYNRGNYILNLENWVLKIGTTKKYFEPVELNPNQYLIICVSGQDSLFENFGKVTGLLSSTSLPTTGNDLVLMDTTGSIIDSVYYKSFWYGNNDKADGGWSLERIDPNNFCGQSNNWIASVDAKGGTPGSVNSVYKSNYDTIAPQVVSWKFTTRHSIQVDFSEELTDSSIVNLDHWHFNPKFYNQATILLSDDKKTATFNTDQDCVTDISYILSLSHISDVCGNTIGDTTINILFHPVKPYEVVISEIMADPTPIVGLPESDYLKLYNRGNFPLNLENWILKYGSTKKHFNPVTIAPNQYLIVCSSGQDALFEPYGMVDGLLASNPFPNSGKDIALIDTTGQLIDSVFYKDDWYGDENKTDGGWSLERVDVNNSCSLIGNWKASVDESGGTPGRSNSVAAQYIDTQAPKINSIRSLSANHILIAFNEPVSPYVRNYPGRFAANNGLGLPDSVRINADSLNWVNLYFTKSMLSTFTYNFALKNIADPCNNRMADTVVTLIYYKPAPYDVVFNEFMADASPAVDLPEVEYIELFNRSNFPVDLTGFTLSYDQTKRQFPYSVIGPKGYLILCPENQGQSLSGYGKVLEITSTSTLTSSGKHLVLSDSTGKLMDDLNYKAFWLNSDKGDGGWALERIDPNNTCSGKTNWAFSVNSQGGTPGTVNSVDAANIDRTKPELVDYEITGPSKFRLLFSETIPDSTLTSTTRYKFLTGNFSLKQVFVNDEESKSVVIQINESFEPNQTYKLQISGITDPCQNPMDTRQINMTYYEALPNDVVISEIMTDPSPVIGLPEQEYIELYNRSSKIFNLQGWYITVNSTKKALGNYHLNPKEYLVLCATAGYTELQNFGNALAVTSFPSITNSGASIQLLDTSGNVINRVDFQQSWYANNDKKDGGWSLEIIDPDNQCGREYNWQASVDEKGGTPGLKNSVDRENIDAKPISLSELVPLSDYQILIKLSEGAAETQLANPANYTLKNIGNPINVLPDSLDPTKVVIEFRQAMQTGENQKLTLKNLADYCGNVISDTTIDFTYYQPKLYDLVINEIMANPEPSVGLPVAEYVELYNRTAFTIYLNGFTVIIGNSKKTITGGSIPSNGFALIAKSTLTDSLTRFGIVIGVESLSQLPLSGTITLLNASGDLICTTSYSSDWFENDLKAEGGYSLERIDMDNPDESEDNWKETIASIGGTPGKVNSVTHPNPDTLLPRLLYAVPVNKNKVRIVFNKLVNLSKDDFEKITIIPTIGHPARIIRISGQWTALDLILANPLSNNQDYDLTIATDVTDVAGNGLSNRSVTFRLPDDATPGDLVINELLFNPYPNGSDFVELYNRSGHAVNLASFYLASRDDAGNLKSPERIPLPGYILNPGSYIAIGKDVKSIQSQYIIKDSSAFFTISALPSLPDDAGTIVLVDTLGNVYDELAYTDKMQFALLESTEGVSLERIDYNQPANNPANWQSASYQAGWATPGYQNSVYHAIDSTQTSKIAFDNEVFSPDNDGYNDQLNITYHFDKPGFVANVTIFSAQGALMRKLVKNELMGTTGFWAWDGLDENQHKVPVGIYAVYFELFNLGGKVEKIQKACVVAGKL